MDLLTNVKAGKVNNLSDARYFAPFAEWIGFDFDTNSPHCLPISSALAIKNWLAGPRFVAEFGVGATSTTINSICDPLMIDTVQLSSEVDVHTLLPIISSIIWRIEVPAIFDMAMIEHAIKAHAYASYYLLDFTTTHTWESLKNNSEIPLSAWQDLCKRYAIILQLPFTPQNVKEVVNAFPAFAINLLSGTEQKVGLRAFDDIDPIIEQLEIEEDWD